MRTVRDHIVEGDSANHQLQITVTDEPGAGGACHDYEIDCSSSSVMNSCGIHFQNGPIKEFGVNGVTQEALLAIVVDRLQCFQAGPYACSPNDLALIYCRAALRELQTRTRERIARGVEGTHTK